LATRKEANHEQGNEQRGQGRKRWRRYQGRGVGAEGRPGPRWKLAGHHWQQVWRGPRQRAAVEVSER
jgi:hypothetical protein